MYYTNVLDYLENSAKNYPNKLAYTDEKNSITFDILKEYAKSLGSTIAEKTNNTIRRPIIVMVKNNVYDIVGFMGTLYSGNFYVPIDEKMPKERLEAIISKLNPLMILHQSGYAVDYLAFCIEENITNEINIEDLKNIRNKIIDIDPAYIIFTSGSTGVPKGIVITHRAIIDLVEWLSETFDFTNEDALGNQTPFYFDASVKDIYLTLKNSLTMHIIPKKFFMFPIKLMEYLNKNKVTAILWATSAINLVANSKVLDLCQPESLHKVFFAGEAMYAKNLNVWRRVLPNAMYVNLYGPTEITVDCTYYIVDRDFADDEIIPIGNNCKNMEIILLDDEMNLDKSGEICVRGTGVSLGYYNETEKTNTSFIQNPHNLYYRDILYKTGDIARYNEFGELVFICRKDGQVKHMGNRIELGEIEVVVNSLDDIDEAVCLFDSSSDKIILICKGRELTNSLIILSLSSKLPKYMLPNVIKILEDMPYNRNGKIDRVKLKEMFINGENM